MFWCKVTIVSALLGVSWCAEDWTFPPGFKFGTATSAYQVEGAWNISDKGESIWDRYAHAVPTRIKDGSNGDVACDSYHLWQTDIEKLVELGVHYYRFSISWPRLLPSGFPNIISEDGVRYYNNLIDGLLEKGIEPFVTLYHYDLPQSIQDLGGWTNPLVADWFADYANVAYSLFGDRVKMWLTINEPLMACDLSFNTAKQAPGIVSPDHGAYLCNKHILLAHAKAYRVYDNVYRAEYNGEVSIANLLIWYDPVTAADAELAELAVQYNTGRYSHAIYSKEGGWPPAIEEIMAENSRKKGYKRPNFPSFTQDEIELIKGTYDFYGLNYYMSFTLRAAAEGETVGDYPLIGIPDLNAVHGYRKEWPTTNVTGYTLNPEGIRNLMDWLKKNYGDMKIVITENGYPNLGGLDDRDRIEFYQGLFKQLILAIKEDGINLTHYTAWALMDNFEWSSGYTTKYGLYEVDFSDPQRTRTARASTKYYKDVIKSLRINV
ncbi:myrosinase 1-like [Anticarsia gemmatalis]|uniref:myrosinase 1-like n=1 Tax=Anticarsia gemmatalis TaxID=129554 RepID=UPI003F76A8C4